jgi:hypothetical protein
VTDRRDFLSALSAMSGWLASPSWIRALAVAPRVEAATTLFFAPPDGTRTLVRFSVTGLDAPAGRLRLYDRARRLLGTAGVLRRGETMYGELWLEIDRSTQVISELEAPGLRGPFRSVHELVPQRKWTLHVLTALDPVALAQNLSDLPTLRRAMQASLYRSCGVTTNPLPHSATLRRLEHAQFLRIAEAAARVEAQFGIPMSDAAVLEPDTQLSGPAVLALAGSGVHLVTMESSDNDPFKWLEARDGSRLLAVVLPPGGTTSALGFGNATDVMAQRIEAWLSGSPVFQSSAYERSAAILVNTSVDRDPTVIQDAVANWNSRFAYPRITSGGSDQLVELVGQSRGSGIGVSHPAPWILTRPPELPELSELGDFRRAARDERTNNIIATLARQLDQKEAGLVVVASHVDALIPGTIVFNPAPFSRSGLVRMTDGTDRVATNVPALGYAYFPDARDGDHSSWTELAPGYDIEGQRFSVRIDSSTGSIASLIDRDSGREWARQGSHGLNSVSASRLEGVNRWRLPDVATRIEARRWAPGRGAVETQVTVYDRLPWVDVANDAEAVGSRAVQYGFAFAVDDPQVAWEVPAGYEEEPAPSGLIEHLRWLTLTGLDDAALFHGLDTPVVSVESDGTLLSYSQRGRARYRLDSKTRYSSPDMPWIFGWGAESFVTARAEPTGSPSLPTFGTILNVERVGIAVVELASKLDHEEMDLLVQELLGVDRDISIGAGLVRFDEARVVDYLGRDVGPSFRPVDETVRVPVRGHGIVALRLSGVELNRA